MITKQVKRIVFVSLEFNLLICDNMKDLKIEACWTNFESLLNFHIHQIFSNKVN